jgi:molybdopterin converting factor small subunit
VRVRLFAALRELAGESFVDVDANDAPDVEALLRVMAERYGPRFERIVASGTVIIGGEPAGLDRGLAESDDVALLPPVSGGRDEEEGVR